MIIFQFYFGSTEWTIWLVYFRFDPFHETVVMENVLARCFSYHGLCLEVFDTDRAAILVLFMCRFRKLFSCEHLTQKGKFLLLLLLLQSLSLQRIVPSTIINGIHIFNRII